MKFNHSTRLKNLAEILSSDALLPTGKPTEFSKCPFDACLYLTSSSHLFDDNAFPADILFVVDVDESDVTAGSYTYMQKVYMSDETEQWDCHEFYCNKAVRINRSNIYIDECLKDSAKEVLESDDAIEFFNFCKDSKLFSDDLEFYFENFETVKNFLKFIAELPTIESLDLKQNHFNMI
jgi:hypothetical protein